MFIQKNFSPSERTDGPVLFEDSQKMISIVLTSESVATHLSFLNRNVYVSILVVSFLTTDEITLRNTLTVESV